VPIQINGIDTNAIVDTASMLTLINKSFLYSIPDERRYGERVSLRNFTGEESFGRYVEDLDITIDSKTYTWRLCEAPIPENVILGFDFLSQCVVDLKQRTVFIDNEEDKAQNIFHPGFLQ